MSCFVRARLPKTEPLPGLYDRDGERSPLPPFVRETRRHVSPRSGLPANQSPLVTTLHMRWTRARGWFTDKPTINRKTRDEVGCGEIEETSFGESTSRSPQDRRSTEARAQARGARSVELAHD